MNPAKLSFHFIAACWLEFSIIYNFAVKLILNFHFSVASSLNLSFPILFEVILVYNHSFLSYFSVLAYY